MTLASAHYTNDMEICHMNTQNHVNCMLEDKYLISVILVNSYIGPYIYLFIFVHFFGQQGKESWPDKVTPGFQDIMNAMIDDCIELSLKVLHLIAVGLKLEVK